ncbi:MAG TPA: hypothetical protein PKM41_09775 [Deltaproteobacteria bacterium]|jgi:hypothetical protein|nr:hypothetical protein [Deltaproteobacteria bacterium]HOI07494.1 hypothetical protein [Deltaproteobacteria bacterium]
MEEILLKNGVRMIVEDLTAVLTGDLYMVHFVFTTCVDLGEEDAELKAFCGGGVAKLTRELKRPAVHERDLEAVRTSMKDSFLDTNLPYMEKPTFPKRFKAKLLKDFQEAEEKRNRAHG